jgi:pimeloyl-ACP methyl ester carboxylesterase
MVEKFQGLKLYYEVHGQGQPVFLLHGWGGNVNSLRPVFNHLTPHYRVYAVDLPGFGRSSPPPPSWGSYEYAYLLAQFFSRFKIKSAHLIGHSFGGRIAIMLCFYFPQLVNKLILVDSAGLKPRRGTAYYLKVGTAKSAKWLFKRPIFGAKSEQWLERIYRFIGSADYRQAGELRPILVRVVNEDLRQLLPDISQSTLLIWGEKDTVTPLYQARRMEKLLPNAKLVVLKRAGHYSYLDKFPQFCRLVSHFLASTPEC